MEEKNAGEEAPKEPEIRKRKENRKKYPYFIVRKRNPESQEIAYLPTRLGKTRRQ